jgi:hypothetical protein
LQAFRLLFLSRKTNREAMARVTTIMENGEIPRKMERKTVKKRQKQHKRQG